MISNCCIGSTIVTLEWLKRGTPGCFAGLSALLKDVEDIEVFFLKENSTLFKAIAYNTLLLADRPRTAVYVS